MTVNAQGLGLCPAEAHSDSRAAGDFVLSADEVIRRLAQAGFEENKCQTHEMIHGTSPNLWNVLAPPGCRLVFKSLFWTARGMTKLIVAHKA